VSQCLERLFFLPVSISFASTKFGEPMSGSHCYVSEKILSYQLYF